MAEAFDEDFEDLFIRSILDDDDDSDFWRSLASSDDNVSSSDSSDDMPPKRICTRVKDYISLTVSYYDDQEFRQHFRLSRDTCDFLTGQLKTILPTHTFGREKVAADKALLMSLWYLGNMESFRQIADRFDVAKGTAHYIIRKVVKFFISESHKYIYWVRKEDQDDVINGFKNIRGIEGVEGVIDGTHIKIPKPSSNQQAYCNRKGDHSIILQAVTDHKKRFRNVFCGEAGSLHDSRVLKKSTLYDLASQGVILKNTFLLGDSAYANLRWLIPPFKDNGNLTRNQKDFNFMHSSTRIVVENAFGLLKGRFRRLKGFENNIIPFIVECVIASCVLHNICINFDDLCEVEGQVEVEGNNEEYSFDDEPPLDIDKRKEIFEKMFPNKQK